MDRRLAGSNGNPAPRLAAPPGPRRTPRAITRPERIQRLAPTRDPALVLVDFDDTLVDTAPRFQQARRDLFARLARAGFAADQIQRVHHEEVDPGMIDRYGIGPFRLEPSFRETYLRLCVESRLAPDPVVADECAALGHAVAGTPPLLDGALEALSRLDAALPTVLYTQSGHPDYQFGCVREAGVLDIIPPERIRICSRKSKQEFRAALDFFGIREPAVACMVGNSMRSDVNPALANGAGAILVEIDDPWEFDQAEPVSDAYITVRSFPQAVDYLLEDGRELDDGGA
jgi:putative hydrolase of the HAD superfamily